MTITRVPTICRVCTHNCPIILDIEDGRAVHVVGDKENPVYDGYTCIKGRSYPELQHSPDRLLHSLHRSGDRFEPIPSPVLMDEVAAQLQAIIAEHGPRSVALYAGTNMKMHPANFPVALAFMDRIGSPMRFTPNTIDQPGKSTAQGLLGQWMAPPQAFSDPGVALLIGINPFVTYNGIPDGHPGKYFRRAMDAGMKLIVIDPRRSDVAKRATLHLQPKAGHDIAILASMIRVILAEGLHDAAFLDGNVDGLEALRGAVAPFEPSIVAANADLEVEQIVEAARMFATAGRGYAVGGTGPNMSAARGTLFEYLVLVLDTICGHWLREGELVRNPGVLIPGVSAKAQAKPPKPAYGYGEKLRVRGLTDSLAGLSTAALPDEILEPGDGQVRALIVLGGNPALAWPDQIKTVEALRSLDLLVVIDNRMTATAKLAHYVVAPKTTLEMPGMTLNREMIRWYATGWGGTTDAYAQYTPALLEPPAGSDVIEDWELFWGLHERMGLPPLQLGGGLFAGVKFEPTPLVEKPSSEELMALLTVGSRIPLETVKQHRHGALFPDPDYRVEPKEAGWDGRLDVANDDMVADLADVADRLRASDGREEDPAFPYRLLCRRMMHVYNSAYNEAATHRGRPFNPAFLHSTDLDALGVSPGELVMIRSQRAAVVAIAERDDDLRPGTVSIAHCYGGGEASDDVRAVGTSTSRLLFVDQEFDRYTGQPLMSNIAVAIAAHDPLTPIETDGPHVGEH